MNKPDQRLIDECDPEVREYIDTLENVLILMELYLVGHEADIFYGINDFAELKGVFKAIHNREATRLEL